MQTYVGAESYAEAAGGWDFEEAFHVDAPVALIGERGGRGDTSRCIRAVAGVRCYIEILGAENGREIAKSSEAHVEVAEQAGGFGFRARKLVVAEAEAKVVKLVELGGVSDGLDFVGGGGLLLGLIETVDGGVIASLD